ncbi:YraN family protein [Arenibacter latericius]|uniref:YraN family protein n=1 Tax=Arenibacter latericius TaxID=86104 RepID=UPI0004277650|nr:YraN family protein [Arenibacter latericius]MDX1363627.1 YraN family protein [Arenibacter latericius]
MGKHNEFGKQGEKLAEAYLIKNGYRIVHKNYRYLKAEIDIIAQKDGILAVVEVKSRSSEYWQDIADTVTEKKIKLIVKAADQYVVSRDLDIEVRFDIIAILKEGTKFKIDHWENAFYHF